MIEFLFTLVGEEWLPTTIDVVAKSNLLLILSAAACWWLRTRSAALRHRVWVFALGGCALMPVLSVVGPHFPVPVLAQESVNQAPSSSLDSTIVHEPDEMMNSTEFDLDITEIESNESQVGFTIESVVESNSATTFAGREMAVSEAGPEPAKSTHVGMQLTWPGCLLAAWLAGFFALVAQIAWAILSQRTHLREMHEIDDPEWTASVATIAQQLGVTRAFTTRQSSAATVPMTCGVLHSVVVVPNSWREWSDEHQNCVLSHELAHIKRNDVAIQLFAKLIAAVYWFNPLVWYAACRLRVEREFACDDAVLLSGRRPSDYADALLTTLRGVRPARMRLGVAMADSARLDKRVEAVLDTARQRHPLSAAASVLFAGAAVCAVVLVGGVTLTTIAAQGTAAQDASAQENGPLSEMITIHGVVFGPDEQPIANAELYVNVNEYQESLALGRSGSDGMFRFQVPRETLTRKIGAGVSLGRCQASLLAVADGMGVAWELLPSKNGGRFGDMQPDYEVRLQMVEDLPITGRIVDQSGLGVAKAVISADVVHDLRGTTWHKMPTAIETLDLDKMTRREIDANRWFAYTYPGTFGVIDATTDDSGRFTLSGLGRHRCVRLRVSGPGVKGPAAFSVLVRDDAAEFAKRVRDKYPATGKSQGVRLFGIKPTIEVQRTRTIAGTIRDAETGQPVEGAEVYVLGGTLQRTARLDRVRTDRKGRYRIVRSDKQTKFTVVADGDEHLYLPAKRTFENLADELETIADIALPRGILIRGKVVEANSDRPIASEHRDFCEDQQPGPLLSGYAKYYPLEDNRWLNDFARGLVSIPFGYSQRNHERRVYIDDKGEFQMAVPPGKGVLLIDATPPRGEPRFDRFPKLPYLTLGGEVTGTASTDNPVPSELRFPGFQKPIDADNFHAYKLIDVASEGDQNDVRFEVNPAPSQSIRFVDPAGRQVTDVKVAGLMPMHDYAFLQNVGMDDRSVAYFDVPINKNRRIVAISGDGEFGVSESIRSIEEPTRTIELQRTASLRFRLIDQESGKPLAGYQFSVLYGNGVAPRRGFSFSSKKLFVADPDGLVTVTSLIPGESLSLVAAKTIRLPDGSTKHAAQFQTPKRLEQLTLRPGEQRNVDTISIRFRH